MASPSRPSARGVGEVDRVDVVQRRRCSLRQPVTPFVAVRDAEILLAVFRQCMNRVIGSQQPSMIRVSPYARQIVHGQITPASAQAVPKSQPCWNG